MNNTEKKDDYMENDRQTVLKNLEEVYKPYEGKPLISIYNKNIKIKWLNCIEHVYYFKQELERVWFIMQNIHILTLIINKGNYPCIKTGGPDAISVGREVIGKAFGYIPFIANIIKYESSHEEKKITWFINTPLNEVLQISFHLYSVTEDNSTILLAKYKLISQEVQKLFNILARPKELFKIVDMELEKSTKDYFQFESGIICGSMEDIWDFIMDYDKLNAIAPNNNCVASVKYKELKVGDKIEVPYNVEGNKGSFTLEVKLRDDRNDWNKWIFVYEVYGGTPHKILGQSVYIELTKINNTHCQLSIGTKLHDCLPTEKLIELSKKKKYLIYSMKDYFDNFYTPTSKKDEQ